MLQIPENYTEFLYWVKETTEAYWSKDPQSREYSCEEWAQDAKWIPLKDEEIDAVEKKYGVQFMPEHREFLKILHTLDRRQVVTHEPDEEGDEPTSQTFAFFYNWLKDEEEIKSRLEWPYETILQDMLGPNGTWLESWGKRPVADEEKAHILRDWLSKAPRLVPLTSHRFLVSEPHLTDRPVLSVYGSDIIVYGWDMRVYLLNELQEELELTEAVYDEEFEFFFPEACKELADINKAVYENAPGKDIPYWKEMILFWSWAGVALA